MLDTLQFLGLTVCCKTIDKIVNTNVHQQEEVSYVLGKSEIELGKSEIELEKSEIEL